MTNICSESQEAIAWGRTLPSASQDHVRSCDSCRQLHAEFAAIDDRVLPHIGATPPTDFVDRVMAKIAADERPVDFIDYVGLRLVSLVNFRPVEIGMASASGALAVFNLVRFVLNIVIPVAA